MSEQGWKYITESKVWLGRLFSLDEDVAPRREDLEAEGGGGMGVGGRRQEREEGRRGSEGAQVDWLEWR